MQKATPFPINFSGVLLGAGLALGVPILYLIPRLNETSMALYGVEILLGMGFLWVVCVMLMLRRTEKWGHLGLVALTGIAVYASHSGERITQMKRDRICEKAAEAQCWTNGGGIYCPEDAGGVLAYAWPSGMCQDAFVLAELQDRGAQLCRRMEQECIVQEHSYFCQSGCLPVNYRVEECRGLLSSRTP